MLYNYRLLIWEEPRNHCATNVIEREGNWSQKLSHFLKVPRQVSRTGARTKFPGSWSSPLALHHSMDAITRTNKRDEEHLVTCALGHGMSRIGQKHICVYFLITSYATTYALVLSNLSTKILEVPLAF